MTTSPNIKEKRARDAVNRLIEIFRSGQFPAAAIRSMLKPIPGAERPCDKWSLGNKILMIISNTSDARGYRQWKESGRGVKKGAKAIYILAPKKTRKIVKVADEKTGEEREKEFLIITGFKDIPVFRLEDTEGEPIPEPDYRPLETPPLQEVAKQFGVEEIRYEPGNGTCYGFFTWHRSKKIVLHTHDIKTWFHELGHAIHSTFQTLSNGQVPEQEIVAELFAAIMCELHGVQGYQIHAWKYIKTYSDQDSQKALKNIFRVLSDVEECITRLFNVTGTDIKKIA